MAVKSAGSILPVMVSGIIAGANEEVVMLHFLVEDPAFTPEGEVEQNHRVVATMCFVPSVAAQLVEQITTLLSSDE